MQSCTRMFERLRVAVIEDDATNREFLQDLLRDEGAQVVGFGTYAEALSVLREQRFDVILSDCIGCGYEQPTDDDRAAFRCLGELAPTVLLTGRAWAKRM